MPRIARVIAPGFSHHVTQRGNFGQDIFDDDQDRQRYLKWLSEYAKQHGTKFWAYCLMTNHVHFIVVPEQKDSLARTFNKTHKRYSQYMNHKHGRRGHLWQERFYSCVLEEIHLYAAVQYVERNPVRAGLVLQAEAYPWSSAYAHVVRKADPLLSDDCPLIETVADWSEYLSKFESKNWEDSFRRSTRTGRPVGSELFTRQMESLMGRTLKALPHGRPPKKM
jgi:putative transposase